ncbi:hypothetical protein SAMN05421823_102676 [Catalinimonas alkaloidigena]|uniref:Porin n=2 Tax=Catalinimonas alkaloidigena TaxID=1075417 RepID=A0A1G9BPN4_9BACT|nr:hypothetical protein SAMN05421823_102676 [Catalinimonas alkaloidigena]
MTDAVVAQTTASEKKEIRLHLNNDGSHYVKATFLNQTWVRYNQSNPGTTVFGTPKAETFDIGLRRTRLQLYGQLTDRIFFYTQFGQNNFNYLSSRKVGAFFHDALTEYALAPGYVSVGAGLTAWSGLSRFASPSVGSILGMDAPLYQQATNDATDEFLRKLSLYAKGKAGKLDYRLALTQPMPIQTSNLFTALDSTFSNFSQRPPKKQYQGYFMYQFLDQEGNTTPYMTGSYLGTKRVFNLGAGFIAQPDAMWHRQRTGSGVGDTVSTDLRLWAVDVFYDTPLNPSAGTALTAYASFSHYDYGPGYLRMTGVMNPANGVVAHQATLAGAGNAFPMYGTGQVYYAQVGYLTPRTWLGDDQGALQPYFALMYADYDRLQDGMAVTNLGVNWLLKGHTSKITLDWQNRPLFTRAGVATGRRSQVTAQYQIYF